MDKIALGGRVVCVVDDDAIYREYLAALLAESKLNVMQAADGHELTRILEQKSVDCIVLDYVLAAETGLSLHQQLRERFRKLPPVVMLTADENQRTAIKAFRIGVSDYVLKRGLKAPELLSSIGNAIARREQEDAVEQDLERLRRQSAVDDVTGVYRRETLEERLERASKSASRRNGQYAVVMIALNENEAIETQFGYAVVDRALRSVAQRLQKEMRSTDVCGRWSADTFIYLVDANTDRQSIDLLAARIEQALSFELRLDTLSCQISVSLGTAVYPMDGANPETIVAVAEAAMAATRMQRAPASPRVDASPESADQVAGLQTAVRQEDRRKERRQRVLKRGQIVLNEMHSVVDCTIRDLTAEGARLRVEGHFTAPGHFDLMILGSGDLRHAHLRWQKGKELGVAFTGRQHAGGM
jgi:two-component system cell cycle response regulator